MGTPLLFLIYSALADSIQYHNTIKYFGKKILKIGSYDRILFKCYKSAIKNNIKGNRFSIVSKRFKLKFNSNLLKDAIEYFKSEKITACYDVLIKYYAIHDIDFGLVRNDFEECLKNKTNLNVITSILIDSTNFSRDKLINIENSISLLNKFRFDKSFNVVVDSINNDILNGELSKAYSTIQNIIWVDDVKATHQYYDNLLLLETKIIIKQETKQFYQSQIEKLKELKESFLRNFYLMRLNQLLNKFENIDSFTEMYEIREFGNELKTYNDLKDENVSTLDAVLNDLTLYHEDSRLLIAKQFLIICINKRLIQKQNEFVKKYESYLPDNESKLYLCIAELNEIWLGKTVAELSIREKEVLKEKLDELMSYEGKFKEYSKIFLDYFYYNITLPKIFLDKKIESCLEEIKKFIDNKILVKRLLIVLEGLNLYNEIYTIINLIPSKIKNDFQDELVESLFRTMKFKDLIDEELNWNELSIDSKSKIVSTKNTIKHIEKKDSFSESDIMPFTEEPNNIIFNATLSEIFHQIGNNELADKYFNIVYNQKDSFTEYDKVLVYKLAELLEKIDITSQLSIELISVRPAYKLLYAKALEIETDEFRKPSLTVDKFFQNVKIEDDIPSELLRIKAKYLSVISEFDRAIEIYEHLIRTFDSEVDWFNYIGVLLDQLKLDKVREIIPEIEKRLSSPIIKLTQGLIYLHIETKIQTKLSKFSHSFFSAFKQLKESNRRFNDSFYAPILGTILMNQLFDKEEKNYITENSYIILEEIENKSELIICIHDEPELAIDFDDEYLESKHIVSTNDLSVRLKFKKLDEKVEINGIEYRIKKIDSLINYPDYFLSNKVFGDSEKYGFKKFEIKEDPIISIFPEMYRMKEQQDHTYGEYNRGNIPFHILSGRNYSNYAQVLYRLLFIGKNSLNAGNPATYNDGVRFVLSLQSILILDMFDKLKTIPSSHVIIPKSLYDEISKRLKILSTNIEVEKLSLDLNEDSLPVKYVSGKDSNLEEVRRYNELMQKLKQFEIIDVTSVDDDLISLVRFIGKVEVDCLRVSKDKNIPAIIDDYITQRMFSFNGIYNFLTVYISLSRDDITEKFKFMLALLKMNFRNVIFPGFIFYFTQKILKESHPPLIGEGTPIGNFCEVVKIEYRRTNSNLNYEDYLNSMNLLLENYLIPSSKVLFIELISFLGHSNKQKIVQELRRINLHNKNRIQFLDECIKVISNRFII